MANDLPNRKRSPYELAPNDIPRLMITQTQLKTENFDEWERAIQTSLRAKKKIPFIDGSISRPSMESNDLDDWISVNSMLVSWIMSTIEPKLRPTITYRESACDLWVDIQEHFNVSNGPRVQQLKTELHTCKQARGMTIADYYAKLKKIWEALGEIDAIPLCECGKCSCKLASRLEKRDEDAMVHQFLMGVDDDLYEIVRSSFLIADVLGNMNKIYSSLIREERLRLSAKSNGDAPEVMSLGVQSNMSKKRVEPRLEAKETSTSLFCTHCKSYRHGIESCFKLHGYPEWWPDRSKAHGRRSG